MASQAPQLHFVLFPLMSPGHYNMILTVVTTPHNASRFSETFARASDSGLHLRLVQLQFPSQDAGLPEGCENFDMLPSMGMGLNFFLAANNFLHEPAEKVCEELTPKPNCIISDVSLAYTAHIATKFNIPRISFYGVSCFCLSWLEKLVNSKVLESVATDAEYFLIPDKVEITRAQTPRQMHENWSEFVDKMAAAEPVTYGVVMNSFKELEPAYARDYRKTRNDKVWCVRPVHSEAGTTWIRLRDGTRPQVRRTAA